MGIVDALLDITVFSRHNNLLVNEVGKVETNIEMSHHAHICTSCKGFLEFLAVELRNGIKGVNHISLDNINTVRVMTNKTTRWLCLVTKLVRAI